MILQLASMGSQGSVNNKGLSGEVFYLASGMKMIGLPWEIWNQSEHKHGRFESAGVASWTFHVFVKLLNFL